VCVYATFLNRAFDQVLMDVALHRLPVTFVLDRAGITGSDGPSHHGMWDLTLLATVPGFRVAAPRDGNQLTLLLHEALDISDGPTAIRYPKADVADPVPAIGRLGSADVLREGSDVLVIAIGALGGATVAAAAQSGASVTVVDPRWLLPIDPALVAAAADYRAVLTVEDNGVHGGYGSAFAHAVRAAGIDTPVHSLGLPQCFIPHNSRSAILAANGLDATGIATAIGALIDL
jgi:1-deoxy-D-xylulose-5-phosphate synthase